MASGTSVSSRTDQSEKEKPIEFDESQPIPGSPTDGDADPESNRTAKERESSNLHGDKDEAFRVAWEQNDPKNPRNFSSPFKAWLTMQLSILALVGSLGSSIMAPAQQQLAEHLHVSEEVTVLAVSLYVLGFAIGPMAWGPVSELFGRKLSLVPAVFLLGIFSIGTATSHGPAAVFITRFFGGIFGSAPVSNVAAALGDIYDADARGTAIAVYSVCVVGGPTLGPVIGAALTANDNLGWRWTAYVSAIFAFVMAIISGICLPETYAPVLLKRKAKLLRKESGDERYWHPHETERPTFSNLVTKHLSRPMRMLITEPMVTVMAFYASFVYGIMYLTLEVFPIVFEDLRGWNLIVSTLPFLGLMVGVLCALIVNLANQPIYRKAVKANNGKAVPEARLPPMLIGGVLFAGGLFWFGWTASPGHAWIIPVIATAFIGAGFNIIFQQCLNFLVDTYSLYAASAVSANTFLRSLLASGLPLAAKPMFTSMGVGPATSLLGAVACALLPAPIIFIKYGDKLRAMSKFAPGGD